MHPRVEAFIVEEQAKLAADALNLRRFEAKVFSQNGEDGVIDEIFRRIGVTNRFFVECGIQDGTENNTRALLEQGWSGLWVERDSAAVAAARARFATLPVQIVERAITVENAASILRDASVPADPDLLSIDIDGNDYWVWKALHDFRPRAVVIEYNASRVPGDDWVMPYDPNHVWNGTSHFGASLDALEKLGRQLGYVLTGCESRGVNAFFVRRDLAGEHFSHMDGGASYHYVSPKYNDRHFGHPETREQLLEDEVADLRRQLAGVHLWIRDKERAVAEQVASLQEHLAMKEREIAKLNEALKR